MEVGQGPNWGCSAKEKKNALNKLCISVALRNQYHRVMLQTVEHLRQY
jgi:hypothetical protein